MTASNGGGGDSLSIGIELGDSPTLQDVLSELATLDLLYRDVVALSLEPSWNQRSDAPFDPGSPVVRRLTLASPLTVVLAEASSSAPWVAGAGAVVFGGLRALRQLLELKKEWDQHLRARERSDLELQQLKDEQVRNTVVAYRRLLATERSMDVKEVSAMPQIYEHLSMLGPLSEIRSDTD